MNGKRKRPTSRYIEDDVLQEATQQHQHQHEQSRDYQLQIVTTCGRNINMRHGEVLLSESEEEKKRLLLGSSKQLYTASNESHVMNNTNTTGGLYITFAKDKKASLCFIDGVFTAISPQSANQTYRIKMEGNNMSEEASVTKPMIPEQYQGEARKNIKYLLDSNQQNLYGWMKLKGCFFFVWCSSPHAMAFVNGINHTLSRLHSLKAKHSSLPCPQLAQLPTVTTKMVWLKIPVPLLQMLGVRLIAWADLTVVILDHLHDVMLIGKTSSAGKQDRVNRNDWDLEDQNPPYNGVSIWAT